MAQLYGACACERNQYTVIVPSGLTAQAQVFFDNSTTSRRAQATPLAAWLRVPLDWYHSTTYALFPDESHATIKRTYNTPPAHATLPPTRRQFCGYCGTHLTAWNESDRDAAEHLDVTLGSLLAESLEQLESLRIVPDPADHDDYAASYRAEEGYGQGHNEYANEMVKPGDATLDDEVHIPTNEDQMGGVEGPGAVSSSTPAYPLQTVNGRMQHRGIPYFEEMVENSRLGRIKRQKGGHTSNDGRTTVQWEVIEIDNSEPAAAASAPATTETSKRRKTRN